MSTKEPRTDLEKTHPEFDDQYFEGPKPRRFRGKVIALVAALIVAGGGFFYVQQANGDEQVADDQTEEATEGDEAEDQVADTDAEGEDADGEEGEEEEETLIPVEVASVERGSISAYISSTANLVPEQEVKVIGEAEGRLERLLVEEGDLVKKGQTLAVLHSDDAKIAKQKAEARLGNAQLVFDRAERMKAQEVISGEEYDKLTMEFRIAKQELAEAEWTLSKRTIRAPFTGQITERFVDLGENVKLADELFTIASYDPLVARIYLPEKDVIGLEVGRPVDLALAAAEDIEFDGAIQRISPVVDTATGTVKVTVAAMEKPQEVRPGGFVAVKIVRERKDDVVLVPRESVIRELNTAHVFVADGETATRRSVEIGMEEGDVVEILSGLEDGESVVTAGQGGLKDGDKIKVLEPAQVADVATRAAARNS